MQATASQLPANEQLDAGRKIRHWYWASVFTQRYSGAVESTTARDFQDVKAWFEDDDDEPAILTEFGAGFRNLDLSQERRRGTSIYNGIFNLLVLHGARDWMAGTVPMYDDLDDHHIVPKSWGQDQSLGNEIDTILNRTPLTSETNRHVISNRLPNEYLPELIDANGEQMVRATLESHFISPAGFDILLRDPFTTEDFKAFLCERQRAIFEAIEDLIIKERFDLTPRLRDLDAQVEEIELALRDLIATITNGEIDRIPSHLLIKPRERMKQDLRKNPGLEEEELRTLSGLLQYFDFRELQDAISGKLLWPLLEDRFGSKGNLPVRFNQLAELRNGIRHSRAVTEVTEKDGEAAILWFRQVLDK